jgi:serine/threonine-protein kinase HipA
MMISKQKSKSKTFNEAYVWIWLPGEVNPVVAGKLTQAGKTLVFNYGQSYLERTNKISIYGPELPLLSGEIPLRGNLTMPACIRDGSPDAWGRRVIINKKFGAIGSEIDQYQLDELTFLLESGSDRIGALDFQLSPKDYQPRFAQNVNLKELIESAERVENVIPLTQELDLALFHGSPIGGARPKALIEDIYENKKYIAKFSSTSDLYSVIKAEYIAMKFAKLAGLDVANVKLEKSSKKDVILVERFDRIHSIKGWQRKNMISALTLFEFDEMEARYASYEILAEKIRHNFYDASKTLLELYKRLIVNILVGNNDDHARNHAAFWDGKMLKLTPAYDICPQPRTGGISSQAMFLYKNINASQLKECIAAAPQFKLTKQDAILMIEEIANILLVNWKSLCEESELSKIDQNLFKSHQFFNRFAFENLDDNCKHLELLADKFRKITNI